MTGIPPCISCFFGARVLGRVWIPVFRWKTVTKKMASVPPCISCLFGARNLGRVLATLPYFAFSVATFFPHSHSAKSLRFVGFPGICVSHVVSWRSSRSSRYWRSSRTWRKWRSSRTSRYLKLLYRHPTNSQTSYEFADILRIHRHPTNSQTSYEYPKLNLFVVFWGKTYSARGGNRTGYRPVPARPQAAGPTTMLIPLRNPAFSAASYAQEMQALGIQESGRIWHLILK